MKRLEKLKILLKRIRKVKINLIITSLKEISTKQCEKTGGYDEALEDFNKLNPQDGTDKSNEKGKTLVGTLKDGRIVNVREHSFDNIPTLEIYDGKKSIKIRYRQN